MSRWSPTVVPWAKDPWEIQAQIAGQLDTGRRTSEFERRGDIQQEQSDRAQRTLEEVTLPGEARAQTDFEIDFAREGGMTEEMEAAAARGEAPQGIQGGTIPDATRGMTAGPFGHMQRTPGFVPEDQQPIAPMGAEVPGNVGALMRLELMGGGSIAAPGQRPQEVYERESTARRGEARAGALREQGLPVGPRTEEYMELGGEREFTPQHEQAGFTSEEDQLNFLYESGPLDPRVLVAMLHQNTASQNRGPTWEQTRKALKTQAVSTMSKYMTEHGVTAQEAWQAFASDPELSALADLVSPGEVGQDVYNAGRPGQYETGVYGQDEEGSLLSTAFSPEASEQIKRVRNGADAGEARAILVREAYLSGDDTSVKAFDEAMIRDEKTRLGPTIEGRILLRDRR